MTLFLNLPESYAAVYTFFFGDGQDALIGAYPELDAGGAKRPLMRAEIGDRLLTLSEINDLISFYNTVGLNDYFNFICWLDYQLIDNYLITLTGSSAQVQLFKSYIDGNNIYNRPVTKPINGTLQFFLNGDPLLPSNYSVDYDTGVVTLTSGLNGDVTVTGEYYTPVRFDTTAINYVPDPAGGSLYLLDSLVLVEVPIQPNADYQDSLVSTFLSGVSLPPADPTVGNFSFANDDVLPVLNVTGNPNNIHSLGSAALASTSLVQQYGPLIEVGTLYTAAFVTAVLLELRRLMPFGIKWFSEDVINNTTTVIGGMLYAESEMYYQAGLSLYTIESQRSPLTAKFDKAKDWFNAITSSNTVMSEVLTKRLLSLYFAYEGADLNLYRQLIDSFFDIQSTLTFNAIPEFLIYDPAGAKPTYTPIDPSRVSALNSNPPASLTKDEYYTIAYKFVDNDWVKRAVPGFPVAVDIALLEDYLLVTEEQYLAGPKPFYIVEEGTPDIAILPLANYLMTANIDIGSASPHLLEWLNDTLLPAGLLVKYMSTAEILGDG